jgi:hypothetical protein
MQIKNVGTQMPANQRFGSVPRFYFDADSDPVKVFLNFFLLVDGMIRNLIS